MQDEANDLKLSTILQLTEILQNMKKENEKIYNF